MVRCRHHRRGGNTGGDPGGPLTAGSKDRLIISDTISSPASFHSLLDTIIIGDYGIGIDRLYDKVIVSDTNTPTPRHTLTDTIFIKEGLQDVPPETMLAWWEFQNTLNDSHTNSLNLSGSGYTLQSSQKLWGTHAVSLSGGHLNNSSRLFLPDLHFSLATWIYGLPANNVLASVATTTTDHDFFILTTDKFIVSPNGQNNIEIVHGGSGTYTNRWNLICAGFISGVHIWISINNEPRVTQSIDFAMVNPGSAADFTIGDYTNYPNPSVSFTGVMQMMAFWTRMLLSTDVNNLYNSGNGLPYPGV